MDLNLYFGLTNKFNVTPLKIWIMNHLQPGKVAFLKLLPILPLTLSFVLTSNAQTTAPKTKQVVSPTTVQSKAVTTPAKATKENVKSVSTEGIQNSPKSTTDDSKKAEAVGTRKGHRPGQPEKKIYTFLETMPQFPGGDRELLSFVRSNLIYPIVALQNNIKGRVIVHFVVNELGKVENPEILKSADPILDKEAIRVVTLLPDFTPGEFKGKKVAAWYTLPINFRPEDQNDSRTISIKDLENKKIVFLADSKS